MSDAKTLEELAYPEYWDARYSKAEADATFEWFKSFSNLEPFLKRHLPSPVDDSGKAPSILHLGCGNSMLPLDLYKLKYTSQTCIDFSAIVIDQMSTQYHAQAPSISWQVMDVRDMTFSSEHFDVAIDKGTLDAMISGSLWDPPEEVRRNTKLYIDEVLRVIKPGGSFLYVTYRQPHFVKPAIIREGHWTLDVETITDPSSGGGGFEYFGYVMRKRTTSS